MSMNTTTSDSRSQSVRCNATSVCMHGLDNGDRGRLFGLDDCRECGAYVVHAVLVHVDV